MPNRNKNSQNNTNSKSKNSSSNSSKAKNQDLKYEIADELGVELGPDATARENGKVGAEVRARTSTNKASRNKSSNSK